MGCICYITLKPFVANVTEDLWPQFRVRRSLLCPIWVKLNNVFNNKKRKPEIFVHEFILFTRIWAWVSDCGRI